MSKPPKIASLCVAPGVVYAVGTDGVIAIQFDRADGPMGHYDVIKVFKGNFPHAIFLFHCCVGIYYDPESA